MIAIRADIPSPRAVSSSFKPPASSLSLTGGSVVYVQMDQQTIADYPVGGSATTPTFRYVYASYIDEPVVRKGPTSTSTAHFYHRNQQYSVTAITTSTGAIAERYAYTAYGQPTILNASGLPLTPQSSTLSNRYTYTGREWDATLGLHHFRARWMSPSAGRFLGRDPIGYEGSEWGLYEFVRSRSLVNSDPTGLIPITCRCHGYSPRDQGGGPYTVDRTVECGGLATNCCRRACGRDRWHGEWWIVPELPQTEIDSCPSDWSSGTDYLTCVACCNRTYEFWNAGAIACGIGGIRVPKPHIQPGQYPTQTWLYGPRRCLPRWCRPTINQVRIVGRCSGVLFIIEGCYDVGIEGSCAAYCAAR
jgi:RHS repeat-associated protein